MGWLFGGPSSAERTRRAERNARELSKWQRHRAGYERQLAGRRSRYGKGDDSTTRGLKADIESCRRAERLYGKPAKPWWW